MNAAKRFSNSFFKWLYPSRCALCSALGDEPICGSCLQEFVPTDQVRLSSDDGPLTVAATLYPYTGRTGQAVRRLKYSRATVVANPLSKMMAEGMARLGFQNYDLIVPIPIHWSRRCMRGFNQSELLAESLPNLCRDGLDRIRRTKPQAQLSRAARQNNLVGAFRARPKVAGKSILLIDDVLTSGQTARECAKALKEAGAKDIAILAFAGETPK
jgi:competence protein ComFC